MDLNYWVEYLDKFHIGHRIPNYDHIGWVKWYNADVYAVLALPIVLLTCCCFGGRQNS